MRDEQGNHLPSRASPFKDHVYHLPVELAAAKSEQDVTLHKALYWEISCEAQVEYINHLTFIRSPHLNKLPTQLVDEIRVILGNICVIVEPADRYTLKATMVVECTLPIDDDGDQDDTITAP